MDSVAAGLFLLSADRFLLLVICSGHHVETGKSYILASAAETKFLQFKGQVLFTFENKISTVQCKRKTI
jgi:hypothetical protein